MDTTDPRHGQVVALLREAAGLHHQVFRRSDGADDDWATWYSDWLVTLSELPEILGRPVVRAELTHELVRLAREHEAAADGSAWEDFYARGLIERLGG